MSWYGKDLNISPSLVALTGGVGRGFSALGNSLVNLGNQKVARAEKDAAKKEKAAKDRLARRGLNIKNRLLNPDATKALAKTYNIDKNSPLYKPGAPSQFNADLGLVDLGKAPTKKAPIAQLKANARGTYSAFYPGGVVKDTGIQVPKKAPKKQKPVTMAMKAKDGKNYVYKYDYNSGKFVNTGHLSAWQGNKVQNKTDNNLVLPSSLGINTTDSATMNELIYKGILVPTGTVKNRVYLVDKQKYLNLFRKTPKKKNDIGNYKE